MLQGFSQHPLLKFAAFSVAPVSAPVLFVATAVVALFSALVASAVPVAADSVLVFAGCLSSDLCPAFGFAAEIAVAVVVSIVP